MLAIVAQAIDRFYKKKDYEAFKAACAKQIELCAELKHYVEQKGLSLDCSNGMGYPSRDWYIYFDGYEKGEFKVTYKTIIQISKIAPFFYVQHEFEVENKDKKRMSPYLDGWGVEAYCMGQFDLAEQITSILTKNGYQELSYADMNEVVPEFTMPEGVTIFGLQVTVEQLLFIDIFEICSRE